MRTQQNHSKQGEIPYLRKNTTAQSFFPARLSQDWAAQSVRMRAPPGAGGAHAPFRCRDDAVSRSPARACSPARDARDPRAPQHTCDPVRFTLLEPPRALRGPRTCVPVRPTPPEPRHTCAAPRTCTALP